MKNSMAATDRRGRCRKSILLRISFLLFSLYYLMKYFENKAEDTKIKASKER
jgi:hypothetical protein